MKENFL